MNAFDSLLSIAEGFSLQKLFNVDKVEMSAVRVDASGAKIGGFIADNMTFNYIINNNSILINKRYIEEPGSEPIPGATTGRAHNHDLGITDPEGGKGEIEPSNGNASWFQAGIIYTFREAPSELRNQLELAGTSVLILKDGADAGLDVYDDQWTLRLSAKNDGLRVSTKFATTPWEPEEHLSRTVSHILKRTFPTSAGPTEYYTDSSDHYCAIQRVEVGPPIALPPNVFSFSTDVFASTYIVAIVRGIRGPEPRLHRDVCIVSIASNSHAV